MKLSLITATYNSAGTLKDCLQTVLEQDHPEIEHLFIDGASSDKTPQLLRDFEKQYPHINMVSEPDKGTYDALNKGVAMATGEVIGFLHSDDFLASPTILSKIMEHFQDPAVVGVYGDLHYVDKDNAQKVIRQWKSCDFEPRLLRQGWMPAHPTLFLRKSVYKKFGTFNLEYSIAADYEFMLRILKGNTLNLVYIPKVITKMRMGGASNKSLKNILQKSREDYRAIKSNGLPNPILVLAGKNLSKVKQFF